MLLISLRRPSYKRCYVMQMKATIKLLRVLLVGFVSVTSVANETALSNDQITQALTKINTDCSACAKSDWRANQILCYG
ncbi:MAG: hypothetical protein ACJATO_002454 [Arenicella sp.]|jgi:hypothetical protein